MPVLADVRGGGGGNGSGRSSSFIFLLATPGSFRSSSYQNLVFLVYTIFLLLNEVSYFYWWA
jgi:hypothetical protein